MESGVSAGAAHKGRKLALVALLLCLLVSFTMKAQDMATQSAPQGGAEAQCTANLKRIFKLIRLYEHQSAGVLEFPQDLVKNIAPMTHRETLFTCPADAQPGAAAKGAARTISYRFVNNPKRPALSKTPPGRIAIVAEERPNHDGKRLVLFYDGSVRAFDEEHFATLKNDSFVDTRPAEAQR